MCTPRWVASRLECAVVDAGCWSSNVSGGASGGSTDNNGNDAEPMTDAASPDAA